VVAEAEADVAGLKGESVPQGSSGFRAVITRDGEAVWRCPHVHFTDHSAKACPVMSRVLAEMQQTGG
jgi:hypothetical protein